MAEDTDWQHRTVLLSEAIDAVVHRLDGVYVDGTYGRGGHSRALLARLLFRVALATRIYIGALTRFGSLVLRQLPLLDHPPDELP